MFSLQDVTGTNCADLSLPRTNPVQPESTCAVFVLQTPNENPGALAGATGANGKELAISSASYRKPDGSAMSRYAKPSHKAVARSLGFALTLGDEQAWATFCLTAYRKLTTQERAALAYAALMSLDEGDAQTVAEAALETFRPTAPPLSDAFTMAAADYRRARDRRAA